MGMSERAVNSASITGAAATEGISIVSTNVGLPTMIGLHQGEPVLSGIRKRPVETNDIEFMAINIVGDGQADLVNHGGLEKAVYAYPFEHLAKWTEELEPAEPFGPASFGENLTIIGVNERQACIGDLWQVGDAVLQICQPRYPCYKLSMATGFPHVVKQMVQNGRTGWYFRVLNPGLAPVTGPVDILEQHPARVTVAEAHAARLPDADEALIQRVAGVSELASQLRAKLLAEFS